LLSARFLLIILNMNRYLYVLPLCWMLFAGIVLAEDEPENPVSQASAASGAAASTPDVPRTEPDIDQTIINNLKKITPPDTELVQLDTSKTGEQLFAFYQAENGDSKQGGIIIFPDDNTHLDWPGEVNHLRQGLTEYGWQTIAIYLPQMDSPDIPERTLPSLLSISAGAPNQAASPAEASIESEPEPESEPEQPAQPTTAPAEKNTSETSTDNDGASKEEQEAYHEQAIRRGQAAYTYLEQREVERFIIMGLGTGAIWAAQYVEQFEDSQDLRLVMLNPRLPRVEQAPDLLTLLPEIESTVIDLYHDSRSFEASLNPISAERRLRVARQESMSNYHQSRLPAHRDNWKNDNPWLLKHVRGILQTHIIKAEQKPAELSMEDEAQAEAEQAPGGLQN